MSSHWLVDENRWLKQADTIIFLLITNYNNLFSSSIYHILSAWSTNNADNKSIFTCHAWERSRSYCDNCVVGWTRRYRQIGWLLFKQIRCCWIRWGVAFGIGNTWQQRPNDLCVSILHPGYWHVWRCQFKVSATPWAAVRWLKLMIPMIFRTPIACLDGCQRWLLNKLPIALCLPFKRERKLPLFHATYNSCYALSGKCVSLTIP